MKSWFVVLIIAFLLIITPRTTFAQNNFRSGQNSTLFSNEVINQDYFASGSNVLVDGTVNGDAYLAGGSVILNGAVNGDLLVVGGNLNINGTVSGNIRAVGGNINLNGNVGRSVTIAGGSLTLSPQAQVAGSLTSAGGNINLLSPIGKGANLAGGMVNIGNEMGGDVNAGVNQLSLAPTAKLQGNLIYWSENKANINPEASVSGKITQNIPKTQQYSGTGKAMVGFGAAFKFFSFLSALLIGFLVLKLVPRFTNQMSEVVVDHWLLNLGLGLLVVAVTPILIILLLITVIGLPLAVLWIFFIGFGLWLAKIFISLALGRWMMKYFKQRWNVYLTFSLGLLVYYLITLIPVLGWLTGLLAALIGLGALLVTKKEYYLQPRKTALKGGQR
ncbi:MAG: polymer-forming cytoskeletal protein [Candidatus Daviesbacteria bacterium]|nr:polymer-forming cytoskeletal protein [Candidatus Daviesbacteria bacterium]